jgi:imidazoleglycerol phosphate dehydratase HisB
MTARHAVVSRQTSETRVHAEITIDGTGQRSIQTGLQFLDHMLTSLAAHARFDLTLRCEGDLGVDDHHTVEDCAIALGRALDAALGDRRGIARFGSAYAPLDESLARAVVDLSGRPHASVELGLTRPTIGPVASENLTHFIETLAVESRSAVHADVLRGRNDHHRAEAAFKALALALRQAVALDPANGSIPSTKGTLS